MAEKIVCYDCGKGDMCRYRFRHHTREEAEACRGPIEEFFAYKCPLCGETYNSEFMADDCCPKPKAKKRSKRG